MAYRVIKNKHTKKKTLEFYATFQRHTIGERGSSGRRLIVRNGREYHVTKGWR